MIPTRYPRVTAASLVLAASLAALGCDNTPAAPSPPPPPAVSVVDVGPEDVPIFTEYAAQTFARDMVEVRARVDGFVEKRLFEVGANVRAGALLYILDVRPYQAEVAKARGDVAESEANLDFAQRQVALAQAQADLGQAEANLLKANLDVERLRPLVEQDAAPKQSLDDALAALKANQANVAARKANVEQASLSTSTQVASVKAQLEANRALLQTAELNLEYASIRAPISGRIGDSLVQVGGLVTRSAAQPLTTIVPLDPIWVRFQVSEGASSLFQRLAGSGGELSPPELVLGDGQPFPHRGKFENTVNQVDPKTGTLEVQATFPNPERTLLPGQFGRIRVQTTEKKGALLVPQRAVTDIQGLQSVMAVGPDNKVVAHHIVTGARVGDRWIVEQGLKAGDRVIVEGLQKAAPGSVVDPKPYQASPAPAPATGGGA